MGGCGRVIAYRLIGLASAFAAVFIMYLFGTDDEATYFILAVVIYLVVVNVLKYISKNISGE